MTNEFTETIDSDCLTPRKLIEALQKIPEEYMDSLLHLFDEGDVCDKLELTMAIDDAEEVRTKWRAGNPAYCLFLEVYKGSKNE